MNKYRNKPTVVDGIKFHSKKEAKRYGELKLLQTGGTIDVLVLQHPYPLVVNGVKIGKYVADFVYYEKGQRIVEDVKGVRTREYVLKKKLMKALYDIDIRET